MKVSPMKKSLVHNEKVTHRKPDPEIVKLVNDINKKFGINALQIGFPKDPETNAIKTIPRIPTGIISLDIALGGGIPEGRFTEISGAYSSTKTTLCLHIIREAQKLGYVCSMHDAEGTTDEAYMTSLGVDVNTLLYSRPDGLEECTQMILDFQRSGRVHLAVIDSIESLAPIKEYESDMQDSVQMGIKPKLLGEFFRKFQMGNNRLVREGMRPFTIIGINQLREKIGAYGDPEYAPGGRAKGFAASVDLRLRRGDWIVEGKGEDREIVGQVVKFKIEKNKTYKRMQTGEVDFYFADNSAGIKTGYYDNFKSIVIEAVAWNLVQRNGAWFYLDDEHKFQGVDRLLDYLRENPHFVDKLKDKILELARKG